MINYNRWFCVTRRYPQCPAEILADVDRRQFTANLKMFDEYLYGKKYWLFDRLTVADFCFVEHWINGLVLNLDYKTLYPNVFAYIKNLFDTVP